MNYRHAYHAGSFADLVKHLILMLLVRNLAKKEKPFTVLDCFAGLGLYDLMGKEALKTCENEEGIKRLLHFSGDISIRLIKDFLAFVQTLPADHYPGSPLIIKNNLGIYGNLIASELHPEDVLILKQLFFRDTKISVHHLDAYNAIKAFVPFKASRGLIFIDPPFEVKDEFNKIINALKIIRQRAFNSQVLLWYPIKDSIEIKSFFNDYKKIDFKESLNIEIELPVSSKYPDFQKSPMKRSGLLIINPPDCSAEIDHMLGILCKDVFKSASYTISHY